MTISHVKNYPIINLRELTLARLLFYARDHNASSNKAD
jgi:hypothetical protein